MAVQIPLIACEDPARTCDHARPSPPPSPPPPPYSLCNVFSPKATLPRRLFDVAPRNLSKGDFLSVVRLLHELVDAFEECSTTSQEQIGLIAEIRKLEQAIIQVESHYGHIESPAQQMVLEHAAQACQTSIYDFVTDARQCRRNAHLYRNDHTERDDLVGKRLDLVTDEDMITLRRCISGHVQSIQTLLITIQVSSTEIDCAHEEIRANSSPQVGQMNSINHSLVLLNNSFATLRQALVDQGSVSQNKLANVDAIREIMVMNNLQLLSALEQLQKSIPAQVLLKEPVIFTDALDRVAPIHLDWITSWDAFLAVLEVRFSHLGSSKIKRREFALQDSATRSELAFTRPIDLCLKPGQHVDMSMIFQDRMGEITKNVCPHCHTVCEGPTDTETICVFCGCQFRRIEEQDDQSEATRDAMSLERIVGQVAPGTPEERLTESIPSEEVGPSDFKKVRLMCSQRLHHTRRTHWSSDPNLPPEQPLSAHYLSLSARQFDDSFWSKIGTVDDKAYPHDQEYPQPLGPPTVEWYHSTINRLPHRRHRWSQQPAETSRIRKKGACSPCRKGRRKCHPSHKIEAPPKTTHFGAPPPPPPSPRFINDSGDYIDTGDLISPNWCGGVVDDTPPNFSLSDDLYGGPLHKPFNGDPSGSNMSPPMFNLKGEILS